jgi:tRNA (guanine37-N1)-methyltransferase
MAFQFDVITLFPEMFDAVTKYGITQRAHSKGLYALNVVNPRAFTQDVHHTVDSRPYGGGPGMVMQVDPLVAAVETAKKRQQALSDDAKPWVIHFSPAGKTLDHQKALALSQRENVVLVASRYEGVDQRFIDQYVDEELSIGDYVLSGGELPAMVLIDAIVRLLPGALGHQDSAVEDSFADGLLDCPHYTRPEEHTLGKVPEVLLSGNHAKIKEWRLKMSLKRTRDLRPDLLAERPLTKEEARLLKILDNESD